MHKISFNEAYDQLASKYSYSYKKNAEVLESMKETLALAYEIDVDITPFFSSYKELDTESILNSCTKQLRGIYVTRLHNLGKGGLKRYYAANELVPDWMKVFTYLVSSMWNPKGNKRHADGFDNNYVKNTTIATTIGWLDPNESDIKIIIRSSRKVTEALRILKDLNYFEIEQKYRHGVSGSYHVIKANWINIIHSFRLTSTDTDMSIRFKKTIRYRVLSFIKNTSKSISKSLSKLIESQRHKYLTNLIKFNLEDLKRSRSWWTLITSSRYRKRLPKTTSLQSFNLDMLVPEFKNNIMTLHIKVEWLFEMISEIADELKQEFQNELEISLKIVRSY